MVSFQPIRHKAWKYEINLANSKCALDLIASPPEPFDVAHLPRSTMPEHEEANTVSGPPRKAWMHRPARTFFLRASLPYPDHCWIMEPAGTVLPEASRQVLNPSFPEPVRKEIGSQAASRL